MGHNRVHKKTMSIPIACFIPAIMPLKALLTVPYRCSSAYTDADILEQGIGSLPTSRGCKGLIEHIIQCMYNLYGPSRAPVPAVGYGFTDLRIYPHPLPLPWTDRETRIRESNHRREMPTLRWLAFGPR